MAENVEYKVDRSGWPEGDWDGEPDREEWRSHGLPCLIVRNDLGALCGYVGVPPGHRMHGKALDDADDLSVHGGISYANACAGHICHVPREGEPDDVWWLGFDCGHGWDFMPGLYANLRKALAGLKDPLFESDARYGTYRPIGYVRGEVERLAEQLAASPGGREGPPQECPPRGRLSGQAPNPRTPGENAPRRRPARSTGQLRRATPLAFPARPLAVRHVSILFYSSPLVALLGPPP